MLKMPKFTKVRTASVARNFAGVATPPARPLSLELCFFWPQGTAGFSEFFLDPFFFRRNKKQKTHTSLRDMRLGEMDVMLEFRCNFRQDNRGYISSNIPPCL